MSLASIKKQICFYLQKPASELIYDGEDMILVELNTVRKDLEKLHNFRHLHAIGQCTVTSSAGFDLRQLETDNSKRFKSIREIWLVIPGGGLFPVLWKTSRAHFNRASKFQRRLSALDAPQRYPGDAGQQTLYSNLSSSVVVDGFFLKIVSFSEAVSFEVKCHTWEDEWGDYTDDESFFVTDGADYLKWAAVLKLNNTTQTFPDMRQEGTVSKNSPERMKQDAVELLKMSDNYDGFAGYIPMP